ncbi:MULTISPECIES: head-tail connector protein [Clostridium]|uniref:head-tail connector protein n=1 Tax=Clostridium TaxID=1485 RepID=UPI0012ED413F|nr:head-tail connector protein [Clostridium saudiense]
MSEITILEAKEHLRIDDSYDDSMLENYLKMAKNYVLKYTGLSEERADNEEDLSFAVLAIVGEFYENRINSVTAQTKVNPMVSSILDMHSINYL